MNAAARAMSQSNFFTGHLLNIRFSRQLWIMLFLLFAVLSSALAVVYITNEHRIRFFQLQCLEKKNQELELQWGQFLLEQASLATPARIEQLASQELQMRLPTDKEIFLLRAQ